jgi:hypothetical protein
MPMSLCKLLILAAFASVIALGCGGAALSSGTAQLRTISAINSPAAVDVFTDVGAVATNLTVGEASGFSSHAAQIIGVTVREAGTSNILVSGSLNLNVNQRYTLYPYQAGSSTYDMIALVHNAGLPIPGKFRLRLVHVDRFSGPVDVYFAPSGANLALETPVIQNRSFESASGYVDLDSGVSRDITVTEAGTTNIVGSPISINAGSGTARTVVLYDDGSDTTSIYSD